MTDATEKPVRRRWWRPCLCCSARNRRVVWQIAGVLSRMERRLEGRVAAAEQRLDRRIAGLSGDVERLVTEVAGLRATLETTLERSRKAVEDRSTGGETAFREGEQGE